MKVRINKNDLPSDVRRHILGAAFDQLPHWIELEAEAVDDCKCGSSYHNTLCPNSKVITGHTTEEKPALIEELDIPSDYQWDSEEGRLLARKITEIIRFLRSKNL